MKRAVAIHREQLLVGFIWMAIAILVFYGIKSLPAAEPGRLGPATFPKILSSSLIGLAALYWFQSRKVSSIPVAKAEVGGSVLKSVSLTAIAVASALLWEPAGALPVLITLSIVELKWIEGFRWPRVLGVGLTLSIGMWVVFTQLLGVNLPLGLLILLY
jgi:Tripartite tricarboxylate transporter TctB family